MWIINAVLDFAGGLARGVSLFFNERGDYGESFTIPEAAWPKLLDQSRAEAETKKPR
jgi:hypothetical protein